MPHEPVDIVLVGVGDAERGFEVLAREREALSAVMRSADDDEERRVGALEHFLEAPGIGHAAAAVVHVRNEGGPEAAVGFLAARQPGSLGIGKQAVELKSKCGRVFLVAADATW